MKVIEQLLELQVLELQLAGKVTKTKKAPLVLQVAGLREAVPHPILEHYDRLMARGKKGVAIVRNGVCTGCRMKLASGINAAVMRDEDITMCDSCARYLVIDPEPAPEPEAVPVKPKKKRAAASRRTEG